MRRSLLLVAVAAGLVALAPVPPPASAHHKPGHHGGPATTTTTVAPATTTTEAGVPTTIGVPTTVAVPAVLLDPTDDVQAALNANPAGATFRFAPGLYRIPNQGGLDPKAGQRLVGAYGAVLSGSKVLTGWTQSGSDWWTPRLASSLGSQADSACAVTGCQNPHDVFYDDAPLVRVTTLAALAPGKFFEDFAAARVYVRDDPNGHTVEQAWTRTAVSSTNPGIQVRNLSVRYFANQIQQGAIEAYGPGWLVEYCDLGYNHGMGLLGVAGPVTVRHNRLHHNGQAGYGGSASDAAFEDNEVDHNNRDGIYQASFEAGGGKWGDGARQPRWRRNYVHDNKGMGIWFDINAGNAVIEDNYVADNAGSPDSAEFGQGIFYEISYGELTAGDGLKTYIRNNTVVRNAAGSTLGFYGGGQISVSASRDVEVYGNWVYGRDGIGCQAQLRTDSPDARGAHECHNVHVYDNTITTTGGGWAAMAGIDCDDAGMKPAIWTSWGNTWESNAYHASAAGGTNWQWQDAANTFATWQGFGHDTPAGSFDTVVPSVPPPPVMVVGPQP